MAFERNDIALARSTEGIMFKYSAPSTQPIVAPEFHGFPESSVKGDEKTTERPELTIVRTASAAPPRLRGGGEEDDGDLMIPEILRKPPEVPTGRTDEKAGEKPSEARFRLVPVVAASAAGLLLVVAAGATIYAAGRLSNQDAGTVAVKTISLEGQTSTTKAKQTRPDTAAPAQANGLDKSGFDLRFNSAKAADPNPDSLKIKNQDRLAKIPLEGPDPAGSARQAGAPANPGTPSPLPVLGYASVPNPHAGWDEGQRAIYAAAPEPPAKSARIAGKTAAGETGNKAELAAAAPAVTPVAPATPANTLEPGPVTETSTVTADVNLRSAAEKDAPVLIVVPKGTSVGVGSCDNWWCAVSFDGRTGFVGKKFVDGKG
jgi:uncharacterized protein YgiM (DUF1202 family)